MEPVTEGVLRAIVGRALGDEQAPRLIAVSGEPSWAGPDAFEVEGRAVEVVPCISVLAAREALARRNDESNEDGPITVLLTDRSDKELGEEMLAHLWRYRVQNPTGWEKVKQLFRVDTLDSALADERWLIELLVRVAPPRGYAPPTSGYLSRDHAWAAFREHGLRLTGESPGLADLLRWAARDEAAVPLQTILASHLDEVEAALVREMGRAAGYVVRLVEKGRGPDAIPLGLVADALWGEVDASDQSVLHARVRFENTADCKHVSHEVVQAWADSAIQVLDHAERRGHHARAVEWRDRAEDLLIDLDAIDLAVGSSVLPQAFETRLSDLGAALRRFLDDEGQEAVSEVDSAMRRVEAHRLSESGEGEERTERARMAVRLCRRHADPSRAKHDDLSTLARSYVEEGAWVDHARDEIGQGETVAGLYEAYDRLLEVVDADRRDRDRAFGRRLSSWAKMPSSSDGVRPIERVLGELVAPIAEEQPVLLLVLDGLSHSEAIKLQRDIRDLGWKLRTPKGRPLPSTVAAFPTVTEVSRASLLTGKICQGAAKQESECFSQHPDLRAASPGKEPVLFHKKELKVQGGQIAPEVRGAVLDVERRVVGAVVNAVDDHLDKGSQLRLADGLRALKPLRPLLDAAAEADRVVVIVSDHGHILEHGTSVKPHTGAGERWRPAEGDPTEDEVRLEGPRVAKGDGAIIAPVTEDIRYVPFEKRGYHGGATPQEVLCPTMVLFSGGTTITGWDTLPVREPSWWSPEGGFAEAQMRSPRPSVEPHVEPTGQATFLGPDGAMLDTSEESAEWIEGLLQTSLWKSQQESAGPGKLDNETAARILSLFEERRGVVPGAVLADRLDLSASRARTTLVALQRIVNFDGYAVLTVEVDGTGKLDFDLLETQFEISR